MTTYEEATRVKPGLQKSRGPKAFLAVSVHGARGLSGVNSYAIIKYGTRENERTQRVTPCFRATTTPSFEEHFLFEHDSMAWAARRLTVVLFDSRDGERRLPNDQPLGKVRVRARVSFFLLFAVAGARRAATTGRGGRLFGGGVGGRGGNVCSAEGKVCGAGDLSGSRSSGAAAIRVARPRPDREHIYPRDRTQRRTAIATVTARDLGMAATIDVRRTTVRGALSRGGARGRSARSHFSARALALSIPLVLPRSLSRCVRPHTDRAPRAAPGAREPAPAVRAAMAAPRPRDQGRVGGVDARGRS